MEKGNAAPYKQRHTNNNYQATKIKAATKMTQPNFTKRLSTIKVNLLSIKIVVKSTAPSGSSAVKK
jgi:formiminotetrahydrofolate cyclodeaminase